MKLYRKDLKKLSRELRNNQTKAEIKLWRSLRRNLLLNVKFSRQKPLYNFILDFYCHKAKLAIELDGAQHFEEENIKKDKLRDEILFCYGIKTLRFTNNEIFFNFDEVLQVIYNEVLKRV